jgi:hypothetical protein
VWSQGLAAPLAPGPEAVGGGEARVPAEDLDVPMMLVFGQTK